MFWSGAPDFALALANEQISSPRNAMGGLTQVQCSVAHCCVGTQSDLGLLAALTETDREHNFPAAPSEPEQTFEFLVSVRCTPPVFGSAFEAYANLSRMHGERMEKLLQQTNEVRNLHFSNKSVNN